ncbi:hypothetical protein GGX14DRAFT_349087 [Mycena pura]|uniref:Uncharacterized protein n=1 Tax=Mycena pura TaxID=153505 RepID=A0AAD6YNR9_9AGAR|nr:hypothetical protein GGX14DRAFT_349087 [Mycena pura]
MNSAFPRFSGRARGKQLDTVPPPHTIQSRGRCQIEIGPHVFSETSFYEVQYLPPASVPASAPSFIHSSWQSSPYGGYTTYGTPQALPQSTTTNTNPLLSSLNSVTSITPALINRVNAAAASNPTLANLLQVAAAGRASAEQLKTLGLLIQSLAVPESAQALLSAANLSNSSATAQSHSQAPTTTVKDFDLVLQYYETSYERWILPRGPVICEKVADTRTVELAYDIALTLALQLPQAQGSTSTTDKPPPQVVTIRLKRPPPAIWETIWRWVGGEEKLNENRTILENFKNQTDRVYLAHRLPHNTLLTQLQTAASSNYIMKPIKPGPVVIPRRRPAQRKPSQPASAAQAAPQATNSAATPKQGTPVVEIRCMSCRQTDVPLILGGRFCRPCVDTGKATTVYVPYRPPQPYQVQQNVTIPAQPRAPTQPNPPSAPPSTPRLNENKAQ